MTLLNPILKLRIGRKLLLSYAVLIFITGSLIWVGSFNISRINISESYLESSRFLMDQVCKNFTYNIAALEKEFFLQCSRTSVYQANAQQFFEGSPININVHADMNNILLGNSHYQYVVYFTPDHRFYTAENDKNQHHYAPLHHDRYQQLEAEMKAMWGRSSWAAVEPGLVELRRGMYDISGKYVGCMIVGVSNAIFADFFDGSANEDYTVLYGEEGNLFFSTDDNAESFIKKLHGQPTNHLVSDKARIDGHAYFISYQRFPDSPWGLLCSVEESALLYRLYDLAIWIFIVFAISFLLACIPAAIISKHLTRRVNELLETMKLVSQGNLSKRAHYTGDDEIAHISHTFNYLLDELNALMEKILAEQAQKEQIKYDLLKFQYNTLQSQLNPHLLYNVLDTINSMAKLRGQPDISNTICLLSDILRETTHKTSKFVTVKQELSFTESFIQLYKTIYNDRFEYVIHCKEDCCNYLVPNLILQPIVENAIIHGIEGKVAGQGLIQIDCACCGNSLEIRVFDNGVGIEPASLAQLNEQFSMPIAETILPTMHIGLCSVFQRIRLLYKDRCNLKIESSRTMGTTVTVIVPLQ